MHTRPRGPRLDIVAKAMLSYRHLLSCRSLVVSLFNFVDVKNRSCGRFVWWIDTSRFYTSNYRECHTGVWMHLLWTLIWRLASGCINCTLNIVGVYWNVLEMCCNLLATRSIICILTMSLLLSDWSQPTCSYPQWHWLCERRNDWFIIQAGTSLYYLRQSYHRATQTFAQTAAHDAAVMAIRRGANSRSNARIYHASTQSSSCACFAADHSCKIPIIWIRAIFKVHARAARFTIQHKVTYRLPKARYTDIWTGTTVHMDTQRSMSYTQ